ncbi:MAG TPA: hypothetical protein VND93_11060 [Myxococcales bacterium]|nr:hypothetical protein [Myxococcales bacterium]
MKNQQRSPKDSISIPKPQSDDTVGPLPPTKPGDVPPEAPVKPEKKQ